MATMPPRIKALEVTVSLILPQCDQLHIYLNDFDAIPPFLVHPKITTYLSKDHLGDLGDVGKFYNCESWFLSDAYIFTVDDKIYYPPDYAKESILAIEEYKRKAVISYHGRLLKPNCKSYYRDPAAFFGVLSQLLIDTFAHELGTGATSFHSKTIKPFTLSIFPTINMTDIWLSIFLQSNDIPILIRRHRRNWVKISQLHDDSYSIHNCCQNDSLQTNAVNAFSWRVIKT